MKLMYPARFKKHGVRIIVAGLMIVGAGIVWQTFLLGPTYQGHTASWWLGQADPGEAENISSPQIAAFRAMGPRAIRYLGRTWASKNLLHRDSVAERQEAAVLLLSGLGPDAAPALPSLVSIFRRPNLAEDEMFAVSSTMAQLAPDKLEFLAPELIADLKAEHPDGDSRPLGDIRLLNAIGPTAKSAIPALLPIARNGDSLTMPAATVALWNIGRETNALVECLSNSLSRHGNGADCCYGSFEVVFRCPTSSPRFWNKPCATRNRRCAMPPSLYSTRSIPTACATSAKN